MIAYADGSPALPGDAVDFDGWPGVVECVIETEAERAEWGLDEPGLMIETPAVGLVFLPLDSSTWAAVVLLGRADGAD